MALASRCQRHEQLPRDQAALLRRELRAQGRANAGAGQGEMEPTDQESVEVEVDDPSSEPPELQ